MHRVNYLWLEVVDILPCCPVRGPAETRSGSGNTDCKARLKAPQSPHENGSLQRRRWHRSAHGRLPSDRINLQYREDKAGLDAGASSDMPATNFHSLMAALEEI